MSSQHFMDKCGTCGTVVRQCRCPDKNKLVTIVTCAACTAKAVESNGGAVGTKISKAAGSTPAEPDPLLADRNSTLRVNDVT